MKKRLELDRLELSFKEATLSVWRPLAFLLRVVLVSISFTLIAYGLIALVFSTRTEKRLQAEVEALSERYMKLAEEEQCLGDVITGLQLKDAGIYEQMFQSAAPNADPVGHLDFLFGSDTIPDTKLISYTTRKAAELDVRVEKVDAAFARIFAAVTDKDFKVPPMTMPIRDLTYPQIGAGTGDKIHPFYKTIAYHNGLDLLASQGEPVYAAADGMVSDASRSSRGQGNIIEITHPGGYLTRYEHLSELNVSKGQFVKRGRRIGSVGMSGQAFAPHLHYEVLADTVYLNPINFIFASVTPEEYANMLFMAANTLQSMD